MVEGGDWPMFIRVDGPRDTIEAERAELMSLLSNTVKVQAPPGMSFGGR